MLDAQLRVQPCDTFCEVHEPHLSWPLACMGAISLEQLRCAARGWRKRIGRISWKALLSQRRRTLRLSVLHPCGQVYALSNRKPVVWQAFDKFGGRTGAKQVRSFADGLGGTGRTRVSHLRVRAKCLHALPSEHSPTQLKVVAPELMLFSSGWRRICQACCCCPNLSGTTLSGPLAGASTHTICSAGSGHSVGNLHSHGDVGGGQLSQQPTCSFVRWLVVRAQRTRFVPLVTKHAHAVHAGSVWAHAGMRRCARRQGGTTQGGGDQMCR